MSFRGYEDYEETEEIKTQITDTASNKSTKLKVDTASSITNFSGNESNNTPVSKIEHIKKLSSQLFNAMHKKTTSTYDEQLEIHLDQNIPSKYDKHQYLDHQRSLSNEHEHDGDDKKKENKNEDNDKNDHLLPTTEQVTVASDSLVTPTPTDYDGGDEDNVERKEMIQHIASMSNDDVADIALQFGDSEIDRMLQDIDTDKQSESNHDDDNKDTMKEKESIASNNHNKQDTFIITDAYYDTDHLDNDENEDEEEP